jgi:hypothetical protein
MFLEHLSAGHRDKSKAVTRHQIFPAAEHHISDVLLGLDVPVRLDDPSAQ